MRNTPLPDYIIQFIYDNHNIISDKEIRDALLRLFRVEYPIETIQRIKKNKGRTRKE